MIPVAKEPQEISEGYGGIEVCHFCQTPTRYWHENTNNPVCPSCAKKHKVDELPDHGKAIRKRKRSLRRKERRQVK